MRKAKLKNPYPQNLLMDILKFDGNYAINYKGLKYALGCLNALQFEIIYRYYKEMRTYKEIGEELNFTPEYICKIKFAAIEKLRNYKLKRYIICKKRIPKEDTISYTYDRDIIEFNTLSDRTYKILMRNALDTPRKMLQYRDYHGDNWSKTIKNAGPKAIAEIESIINPILIQLGKL